MLAQHLQSVSMQSSACMGGAIQESHDDGQTLCNVEFSAQQQRLQVLHRMVGKTRAVHKLCQANALHKLGLSSCAASLILLLLCWKSCTAQDFAHHHVTYSKQSTRQLMNHQLNLM